MFLKTFVLIFLTINSSFACHEDILRLINFRTSGLETFPFQRPMTSKTKISQIQQFEDGRRFFFAHIDDTQAKDPLGFEGVSEIPIDYYFSVNFHSKIHSLGFRYENRNGKFFYSRGHFDAKTFNEMAERYNQTHDEQVLIRAFDSVDMKLDSNQETDLRTLTEWADNGALVFAPAVDDLFFHDRSLHLVAYLKLPNEFVIEHRKLTRIFLDANPTAEDLEQFNTIMDFGTALIGSAPNMPNSMFASLLENMYSSSRELVTQYIDEASLPPAFTDDQFEIMGEYIEGHTIRYF